MERQRENEKSKVTFRLQEKDDGKILTKQTREKRASLGQLRKSPLKGV